MGFHFQRLEFLLCKVDQGPAIRAVRVFSEWNLEVGSPQGRGLATHVTWALHFPLFINVQSGNKKRSNVIIRLLPA